MFCHKCGHQLPEDSGFCHKCGAKLTAPEAEQQATEVGEPAIQSLATNQATSTPANANDFKAFVDNHVRATTKFQSADDLLKNSKPWMFIWICLGATALVYLILGLANDSLSALGFFVLVPFFGYAAIFIASGVIRMRYRGRYSGEFTGDIDINDLFGFLNEHLKHISPDFHEWGYLSKKGLLPILENAIANATEEIRICSEFGPNRKHLVSYSIKPKTVDAKPGEKLYFINALKNGFLVDGRAAGFLGHGTLIRTAPILQAAMKYYIESKGGTV